jgi:hypothetical protein
VAGVATSGVAASSAVAKYTGPGGEEFAAVKGQKFALAEEISTLSPSIDERARVQDTLDTMETQIESGNVDASTAIDAVERMKMGENVTESAIAALGPSVAQSPEDFSSLVGAPSDSPAADGGFDIAGTTIQNALFLAIGLSAAGTAFAKLAERVGTLARLDDAVSQVDDGLTVIFGGIPFIADRLKDAAKAIQGDVVSKIESDGVKDGAQLYEFVAGRVEDIRNPFANDLLRQYEQNLGNPPIDGKLAELDDALGADNGTVDLEGTQTGAERAAADGMDRLNEELRETKNELNVTNFIATVSGLLAVAGGILVPLSAGTLSIIGTALSVIGTFFSLGFTFLAVTAGTAGMANTRAEHNMALDGIISGTTGV